MGKHIVIIYICISSIASGDKYFYAIAFLYFLFCEGHSNSLHIHLLNILVFFFQLEWRTI